jgi:dihydrodipicolinate synthase/N-acetylneuraminate lyase
MNLLETKTRLAGAMISVATPATQDLELDLDAYRRNLRFMIERGAATGNAVFLVAAAGGEFPMLCPEQRKELMRVAVETVEGKVAIAASIQDNSTRIATELATYARGVGVAVGQLSAPYYYPPTSEDIYRYFADVATGSGLPIMVYNNWWNTSNMNLETVERLVGIDGVVALKWSAPSHAQYFEGYERLADRLAIVDNEGQHVTASLMGATGFVTHIGNFWPEYPQRLWRLMREGAHEELLRDALVFKRAWRRWTERVMAYTEGEGPFIKAALDAVGLPSGHPFPPGLPVTDDLRQELRRLFDEYNVPMAC